MERPAQKSVQEILASYNAKAPLAEAHTIPAPWYTDSRIAELERLNVFSRSWQFAARLEIEATTRRSDPESTATVLKVIAAQDAFNNCDRLFDQLKSSVTVNGVLAQGV